MPSLKNFKSSSNSGENQEDFAQSQFENAQKKYGNMSEDQLLSQLKRQVRESKANGDFSLEQMQSYVELLSPYLSDEQKQRISKVLQGDE